MTIRIISKRRRLVLRAMLAVMLLAVVGVAGLLFDSYRSYAKLVDARLARGYLTSRGGIFAAPRTLRPGQKFSRDELAVVLRRAGYLETDSASEIWNGTFAVLNGAIEIRPANDVGFPEAVRVTFDRNGRIAEITGDGVTLDRFALEPEALTNDARMKEGARRPLAFKEIPPVLVQAITSIEDRRFFDHHGLDVFGVARALLRNAGDERIGQGGSTITQQLVKNTYLTPERTLRRKYAEAMLAFTIERRLSKEDIFALYCNEIYLGQRGALAVRGVDQAARVYFRKALNDLTFGEAATIAGMIQSPAHYSPVVHNDAARARRNTVLGTMVRDGFITLEQAAASAKEPLTISDFDPARESSAPYFIDYVNRVSEARASARAPTEKDVGAPIITTLDLDLQRFAEAAIKRQLDRLAEIYKPRGLTPQAALVALDPRTGDVLAMVGGKDYAASQLNRASDAHRQPGSVFKPFVYAAALESGMSPLATFKDAPREFTYDRRFKYRPANYGGGYSMRDVWLRTGLIKSLNVVTVDVAMQTGLARVADTAQSLGLPRPAPYPALALGTTEVSPMQIAVAYAAFANGGRRIQPNVVARSGGAQQNDQVVQPGTAFMITDMLEGVIDHGTARAARGLIPKTAVAGKTGTSRDGWFVGYTPNLVCAVWIGFDDNKQLGLTGAEAALPAWVDFMKSAVDLRPELGGKSFDRPDGITIVEIDPETGQLATGKCPLHERIAIATTQAPFSECYRHNVYFDLTNSSEQARTETPVLAKSEMPHPKNRQKYPTGEFALLRDTRVDTDKRGRPVLVNEMRTGR
ncbi:MAG TPA: PBP1A family penicillin-binding protein [Pyrinomonadaceae bacterium]|nr:PBP1A family penicillin-binding protein [Pyrinomonadaceae bacterium]